MEGNKAYLYKEAESLLSRIKSDENQIQRKKRWLLDIAATKSDRKHFKKPKFLKDKFLPESLLREDDIFYESTRTYVEALFGVCHIEGEFDVIQDDMLSVTVKKVLGGLKIFSCQTLNAMHRKLKGVEATIPQLRTGRKKGSRQNDLIGKVGKIGIKMLSKLGEGDELPKPLAKAIAVADLSLRLAYHKDIFLKKFDQFAPKVKFLQDDIMKAIWQVEKMKIPTLRSLVLLIEPTAEISNKLLRPAFIELLTEFLFECNDMDKIPKSLLDILNVINGSSGDRPLQLLQEEKIKQEIDGILNLSAQTKQLTLDLLADYEFDEDFADAYVEQLVESNADDYDDSQIGETRCFTNGKYDSTKSELGETSCTRHVLYECNVGMDPGNIVSNFLCEAAKPKPTKNMRRNQYLAIQAASDKTSMLTHKLIGGVLWEFAKLEGLHLNGTQSLYLTGDNQIKDVKGKARRSSSKKDPRNSGIVRAVEKLVPSFLDSGAMERLNKLIGW